MDSHVQTLSPNEREQRKLIARTSLSSSFPHLPFCKRSEVIGGKKSPCSVGRRHEREGNSPWRIGERGRKKATWDIKVKRAQGAGETTLGGR